MYAYSPLLGKFKTVFDFVIKNFNSIIKVEKWQRTESLPNSDDGIVVWDYIENLETYSSKYEVLIFIPVSPDFVKTIENGISVNRNLAQNFRFREDEFLSLFPVNRNTQHIAEIRLEHIIFSSDLIAQQFILLSGYDEQFSPKDQLNRNTFKGSLIEHFKLIYRALSDETNLVFIFAIHSIGIPESIRMHDGYTWRLKVTHDIDHLKKWTPGYFIRSFLSSANWSGENISGLFSELIRSFYEIDPFKKSLEILISMDKKFNAKPAVFLRSGYSDKRDSKIDFNSDEVKKLVELQKNNGFEIGIHPSIKSASDFHQMEKDWNEITSALPSVQKIIRQHFLMYDIKKTPFIHREIGFTEDYTVGFTDHDGLKRATVNPFYAFDFENWEISDVKCIPLVAMDVTFQDYRKISAQQAFQFTKQILDEVIRYQGHVSILVHNSYTESEGYEWLKWFDQILDYGKVKYGLLN